MTVIPPNQAIKNYLEYLEQKSDREIGNVVKAMEACRSCREERKQYYLCLLEHGLSLRQIGILAGVSKQAIREWVRKP